MSEQRYRFGPLERRGLLLGLRFGQLACMLTGCGVAVVLLAASTSAPAVVLALTSLLGGVVVAVVPIANRTVDEWLPVLTGWLRRCALGERRHASRAHLRGHRRRGTTLHAPDGDPPPPLRGVGILGAPLAANADMGIVHDRAAGTYTAVIALRGTRVRTARRPGQDARAGLVGRRPRRPVPRQRTCAPGAVGRAGAP